MLVELSKCSSGISDFIPLPCTLHDRFADWQELQEWNFFDLAKPFFRSYGCFFKFFSKGFSAGFSTVSSPFTHLWYFQALELFKIYFLTTLCIDDRMIPVCSALFLGAKFAWDHSSCEQTNSFIKSMFSSVETVLGFPEPCLLSVKLVFKNFFNRRLTEEYSHFLGGFDGPSKFCKPSSFFVCNQFEWLLYLHLKKAIPSC